MPIVMLQQVRRFKAKVIAKIADARGYCVLKKMHYNGFIVHILASFTKGSFLILKCIGVTYLGMNNGKAYKPISYDDELSPYEKFSYKAYPAIYGT